MTAEQNRLSHFRAIVEGASPRAADGRLKTREGFRAVALATGLEEEYVYQLYTGKKLTLGKKALELLSNAYAEGRPAGWMDLPVLGETAVHEEGATYAPHRPPTIDEAMERLAEVLLGMDEIGRELASSLLTSLSRNLKPEAVRKSAQMLEMIYEVHRLPDDEPQPPRPQATSKSKPTVANAARAPQKATLELRIAGGATRQLDLPLRKTVQNPFTDKPPPREEEWYERIGQPPKREKNKS